MLWPLPTCTVTRFNACIRPASKHASYLFCHAFNNLLPLWQCPQACELLGKHGMSMCAADLLGLDSRKARELVTTVLARAERWVWQGGSHANVCWHVEG